MDRRTDGPTDGPTKRGVESRSTRLKRKKSLFFFNHRGEHVDHSLSVCWSARLSVSHNYTSSAFLGFFAHQPLPKYPTPPLICSCEQGAGSCERVWPRFCNEEFRSSLYFYEFRPLPKQISAPAHFTDNDIWSAWDLVTATAIPYVNITSCIMLNPCPASCWYSRKKKKKKDWKWW